MTEDEIQVIRAYEQEFERDRRNRLDRLTLAVAAFTLACGIAALALGIIGVAL